MKRTFKITFRRDRGMFYECRLIEAENVSEAIKKLGTYWTIRNITVLCNGTTKNGEPCGKYSYEDYCHLHRDKS